MIAWLRRDSDRLPPTHRALPPQSDAPGLLAAGGTLTPARLTEAYSHGIFPWFSEGQPVLWWSPEPRMVLQTDDFKLSRSLRKTIAGFRRTAGCGVRIDSAFHRVIEACAGTLRDGQAGTWIVPAMVDAYTRWHARGAVHSFETWADEGRGAELVGGLYGVCLGRMFFGESMFSHRTDASKIALAALVCFCRANGIDTIDCQQNTAHLASMGAREMPRDAFEARLATRLREPPVADWSYHDSVWDRLNALPHPGTTAGPDPQPRTPRQARRPGNDPAPEPPAPPSGTTPDAAVTDSLP